MNCLPCLRGKNPSGKNPEGKKADEENSDNKEDEELLPVAQPKDNQISKQPSVNNEDIKKQDNYGDVAAPSSVSTTVVATPVATDEFPEDSTSTFKFQELASATKNFKQECLLGESGFGKVYKGTLADGKVVAIKQLDAQGTKENKEFTKEAIKLSNLRHQNLVELIGHCADGDQRLLVYEYMQMGSIKDHLHELPPGKKPLDWITRMKAAAEAAKAIEYLHEKINPPVLCRNIKSTNVLLDENFKPKLGDYGLVNLENSSSTSVQERVMRTVGVAPEYEYKGEFTLKSDVYSFGVIMLELITGRKALDTSSSTKEQNLVSWAQPYFKDPEIFHELADPMFKGVVPEKILNQAIEVAARCLQEDSGVRPLISDIVGDLNFLTVAPPEGFSESPPAPSAPPKKYLSSSSSSSSSSSGSDSEHELDFKIEPFNRPEPQSQPGPQHESEHEHESEQEHEWESDPETDPEPEPEPELDLDTDSDSDSESDTESEPEPEPMQVSKPEPVFEPASHKDQPDSKSDSDSDSDSEAEQVAKPEPVINREPSTSQKDEPQSDPDSNSTSGSIYDEDAYSEEDFSDDDQQDKQNTSILINSKSKARMKTKLSKKKVMFKTEEPEPNIQRVKTKSSSRMRKTDLGRDENSDTDDEFEPQRFKSTISRFTAESRCYSAYQDGSSSEGEN